MLKSLDDVRRRPEGHGSRVPPHNLQAEESLLGAMLLSRDAIVDAVQVCGVEDFYKPAHGHVFGAITSLYARGEPADPVTVADELGRAGLLEGIGGPAALISLQANTPATTNAHRYARIVEEHALLRRLIGVANEIAELGYVVPDDVTATVDRAEAMVFEIAQRRVTDTMAPLRDLLEKSLDHLEALYERGEAITGVPTGYTDLDDRLAGLQPSNLVIVGARPAMGKCQAWDTPMVDPATGAVVTIEELHRRGQARDDVQVVSLGQDQRLRLRRPSAFVDDGVRPVYRVRTRLGREVRSTLSHPYLTPEGWRPLADIAVGRCIAVPRQLPVFGHEPLPEAELCLLAYVLGERGPAGSAARVTGTSPPVLEDLRRHAAALGVDVVVERRLDQPPGCWLANGPGQERRALSDLLRRHGVLGRGAQHRAVPAAVYRLPRQQVALFLNRLFVTNGSARWTDGDGGDGYWRVSFCSVSKSLVRGVQHLLLRFGINARVRRQVVRYHGDREPAYELDVVNAAEIVRFAREIGIFGKEATMAALVARAGRQARGRRSRPAPAGGVGKTAIVEGLAQPTVEAPPEASARDVYWDEVVAITPDGEEQVYDLTVPGDHNFVAADVFVHNTSFALGVVAHAAMDAGKTVLLFSLEMSHHEITQRLLCSEARVDATRMRNGKLLESDWPKISHAIGRLGEAPIFVDDNPNLTVMDIRARARRLKSREGLGLVVVDYLQLMSGRHAAENRQVEVAEISRGLKILARELEVPVVALSQLSRNVETRADKRPVLADLRESGSLEQDADVVMFLYRDEIYNAESPDRGTAEVIVAKHRNGPTGVVQLAFLDHYTRFANMARV